MVNMSPMCFITCNLTCSLSQTRWFLGFPLLLRVMIPIGWGFFPGNRISERLDSCWRYSSWDWAWIWTLHTWWTGPYRAWPWPWPCPHLISTLQLHCFAFLPHTRLSSFLAQGLCTCKSRCLQHSSLEFTWLGPSNTAWPFKPLPLPNSYRLLYHMASGTSYNSLEQSGSVTYLLASCLLSPRM